MTEITNARLVYGVSSNSLLMARNGCGANSKSITTNVLATGLPIKKHAAK